MKRYVLFRIDQKTGREVYYAPDWCDDSKTCDDPANAMPFQSAAHAYRYCLEDETLDDWRVGKR